MSGKQQEGLLPGFAELWYAPQPRGMSGKDKPPIWHAGGQRFDPAWLHQFSAPAAELTFHHRQRKIGGAKRLERRQATPSGSVASPPGRRGRAQAVKQHTARQQAESLSPGLTRELAEPSVRDPPPDRDLRRARSAGSLFNGARARQRLERARGRRTHRPKNQCVSDGGAGRRMASQSVSVVAADGRARCARRVAPETQCTTTTRPNGEILNAISALHLNWHDSCCALERLSGRPS